MKRFIKYALPFKPYFIFGPLFILCGAMGEVLLPRLAAELINSAVSGEEAGTLVAMALPMIAFSFVFAGVTLVGTQLSTRASILFSAAIRKEAFSKIQRFSFSGLDAMQTGSLITRLTNDTAQIQQFTMQMLRMGIRSPAHLFGAVIMAFFINSKLAAVIIATAAVLAAATALIVRAAMPRFGRMQEKIDQLNALVQEAVSNIRLIKSFVRGEHEIEKFKKANVDLQEAALKANRVMLLQRLSMTLSMNAATIAVVWIGGGLILQGSMPVGDLAAFITYVTQILTSLMMFSNMLLTSSRAIVSARRIAEALDQKEEPDGGLKGLSVREGSVEFKNVSFRYFKDNPNPVLENISFSIEPGQTAGLVGSTGSGKTTLVQMIPGLLRCDEGQVLVDGVDAREYERANLRRGVHLVLQNNILFSGTIKENLSWGKGSATPEEMARASETAQARLFMEDAPDGPNTELAQGGANLSGGQRQRLCLARSILYNPKILIMDDSTSAVDTATESRIRAGLRRDLNGVTKIIIAQRISSVQEADKILVLEKGRLVGVGRHEDLLEENEVYRRICFSQQRKDG
ncbi:MAG: ABC transporter ATP-binding protein/permease [Clostridiales bacterium]|jgi:ATP-binding cassette subfamily B protein|nr:ABC transporter ATP-binding protein/permease [Clostridiales bacterium]